MSGKKKKERGEREREKDKGREIYISFIVKRVLLWDRSNILTISLTTFTVYVKSTDTRRFCSAATVTPASSEHAAKHQSFADRFRRGKGESSE